MNKILSTLKEDWKETSRWHKLLAILGGIDVSIYIFTPILLASIWLNIFGASFLAYSLFGFCLLSTLFRAIKIGFMK